MKPELLSKQIFPYISTFSVFCMSDVCLFISSSYLIGICVLGIILERNGYVDRNLLIYIGMPFRSHKKLTLNGASSSEFNDNWGAAYATAIRLSMISVLTYKVKFEIILWLRFCQNDLPLWCSQNLCKLELWWELRIFYLYMVWPFTNHLGLPI